MRSVVLFGLPGVGKTKLGELAAEKTRLPFFDGDEAMIEYIHRTEGEKGTIKDPVAAKLEELGDEGFLHFEALFYRTVLSELIQPIDSIPSHCLAPRAVLSFSGSASMVPETVEFFKKRGAKFLLIERPESQIALNCETRADGTSRIVGMEKYGSLQAVFHARRNMYRALADRTIDLGESNDKSYNAGKIVHCINEL